SMQLPPPRDGDVPGTAGESDATHERRLRPRTGTGYRLVRDEGNAPSSTGGFMTAIERALDTAFEAVLQMKLSAHGKAKFVEECKRELEKAVPARVLRGPIGLQDEADGWNECRKAMGLGDE